MKSNSFKLFAVTIMAIVLLGGTFANPVTLFEASGESFKLTYGDVEDAHDVKVTFDLTMDAELGENKASGCVCIQAQANDYVIADDDVAFAIGFT